MRCHVVVLTGTGSSFSAGQDLKEMARLVTGEASPEAANRVSRLARRACSAFEKPLLAAVNGVGRGPRVHAAAPLRPGVHGRRRPPPGPLRRARRAPRGGQQLHVPEDDGMAARRPAAVHRRMDDRPGGGRRRAGAGALPRGSHSWRRRWSWPEPSRRCRTTASWPASGCCSPPGTPRSAPPGDREDAGFAELLGTAANLAALDRFGDLSPVRPRWGAVRGAGRMTGRP